MKHKYECKISYERFTVFHIWRREIARKSENICTQLHFACMYMTEIQMGTRDRSVIVLQFISSLSYKWFPASGAHVFYL